MKNILIISFLVCCIVFLVFPLEVISSNSSSFLFEKALTETRDGNFPAALNSWNDFLLESPNDPAALSNRGNIRLILGDPKGAIIDQNASLSIVPSEIDPHLNRGIAEEALHHWNEAQEDYQWILQREPDNPSALYNLANVFGSKGDWLKSKVLLEKVAIANPEFAMARSAKALVFYQLHQIDDAEKELRSLIRKYPMFADARAALSALLWEKGELGEAESHWAAAVGLDSRYKEEDWLLNVRRWPPKPTQDLMAFLKLERL